MARVWSPCQSFAIPWRNLDNGQLVLNISTQRQHFERDVSKIYYIIHQEHIRGYNSTVIMLFLGWGKAISKNTFAIFIAEHFNESNDFSFILENFQLSQLSLMGEERLVLSGIIQKKISSFFCTNVKKCILITWEIVFFSKHIESSFIISIFFRKSKIAREETL